MWRLAASVALAVLLAGGRAAETQDCAQGDDQCIVGADHALLATKVQVERSRASIEAQPVPPVSTTMKCVISVTILYFIVFTSLFIVSSAQDATGQKYALHDILVDACDTVVYAPMISVLFIGTRMRAIAVTKGNPELYGLPQWWCKDAMVVSSCCVFALTLISLAEHVMPAAARALTIAQYAADALLYAGFAAVSYGLYTMDTPKELGASAPISDTAKCVMYLTLFYFVVAILHQLGTSYDLLTGKGAGAGKEEGSGLIAGGEKTEDRHHGSAFTRVMHQALKALDFAPQICILFLGARMRALQLGHTDPQQWALYFFFAATTAIMAYSIVVSLVHYAIGQNKALSFMEGISLLVLHVSTAAVIASVFMIEAVSGPTPFISTTVRVIMCMTVLFFFVHTVLFIFEQLTEAGMVQSSLGVETFTACMESVMFVPMMCALFLGTRMRALQLSHNTGAPQGWAQDFMMLATWAISLDLVIVLAEHSFGSPDDKHIVSRCFQAICLTVMHVSTSAVIASIFLQTVENTSVNGADTLIPGFKIPGRA
jgi:hypothetical protein